jgi:hypothetical protein
VRSAEVVVRPVVEVVGDAFGSSTVSRQSYVVPRKSSLTTYYLLLATHKLLLATAYWLLTTGYLVMPWERAARSASMGIEGAEGPAPAPPAPACAWYAG